MKVFFETLWDDIRHGENIDLYITISAAIVLTVLNLFSIGLSLAGSITLAVLALLAISTLVNRHKLDNTLNTLIKSTDRKLLENYPQNFEEELAKAKELWVVGINLGRTVPTYYRLFETKIKNKGKLKFVVVHPNSNTSALLTKRANRPVTPEEHDSQIKATLTALSNLKKLAPTSVEVRTIDSFPLLARLLLI